MSKDFEYYNSLKLVKLSQLLDQYGDTAVSELLQTFVCNINPDLEDFLHNLDKAIRFDKGNISKTYIYFDKDESDNPIIMGYFTITQKVLNTDGISRSTVKKLDGVDKNREHIACFLIAQLGKSTNCKYKIGKYILKEAIDRVALIADIGGVRFILIDALNNEKVIDFYREGKNAFVLLEEPEPSKESVMMYLSLV